MFYVSVSVFLHLSWSEYFLVLVLCSPTGYYCQDLLLDIISSCTVLAVVSSCSWRWKWLIWQASVTGWENVLCLEQLTRECQSAIPFQRQMHSLFCLPRCFVSEISEFTTSHTYELTHIVRALPVVRSLCMWSCHWCWWQKEMTLGLLGLLGAFGNVLHRVTDNLILSSGTFTLSWCDCGSLWKAFLRGNPAAFSQCQFNTESKWYNLQAPLRTLPGPLCITSILHLPCAIASTKQC